MCGAAILIPRWRRRNWRQPRPGESFSIPIVAVAENGGPSASGPHFRKFREWGHPRWRPEAEGPPFSATATIGIEKLFLYYLHTYIYTYILTQSFWTGTKVIRRKHIVQPTGFSACSLTCCQWDGEDVPAPWERSNSHPRVQKSCVNPFI